MEVGNYANVPVNRGMDEVRESPKILPLVGVSFLLVCIIQSTLHIYFWQQQVGLSQVFNVSECNATLLSENDIREQAVQENYVEEISQLKQDKAKLRKENNQLKQEKNNLVQEKNKQLENEQNFKNERNQLFQEKKVLQDDNNKLKAMHQENEEIMKHLTEEKRKLQDQISTCEITAALPHLPSTLECPPEAPPAWPPVTPPVCPPGWHTLKGSCYWVSCEQSTWFDARIRCESKGADLVIVNDETELSFLSSLVGTSSTWVGLYVKHNIFSQTLVWVDGSTMTFRPNDHFYDGTSQESCMYMKSSLYYSSICYQIHGWMCEKKLEKASYLRT